MLYQKNVLFVLACKARKMANLQKLFAENIAIFININICNCNVVVDSLFHIYKFCTQTSTTEKYIISNQAKHLIIYHTSFIFQDWTGRDETRPL